MQKSCNPSPGLNLVVSRNEALAKPVKNYKPYSLEPLICRDFHFKDYHWIYQSIDDPDLTHLPDSTLLNRHEGYEMHHIIRRIMERLDLSSQLSRVKVERIIRERLPLSVKSRHQVIEWVCEHFYSLSFN